MSTVSQSRPRGKTRRHHERSVRILEHPANGTPGLLEIVQDGETSVYWFAQVPSDIGGRGFELRKLRQQETYHVLLAGQQSTCTCKGGTYGGYCRHADGLAALESAGKLPAHRSTAQQAHNAPEQHDAHEASIAAAFTPRAKDVTTEE